MPKANDPTLRCWQMLGDWRCQKQVGHIDCRHYADTDTGWVEWGSAVPEVVEDLPTKPISEGDAE